MDAMDFSRPGRPPISRERTPPPPISSPPPSYTPNPAFRDKPSSPSLQISNRRPLSPSTANSTGKFQGTVLSSIHNTSEAAPRSPLARKSSFEIGDDAYLRKPTQESENWEPLQEFDREHSRKSSGPPPVTQSIPYRQRLTTEGSRLLQEPQAAVISSMNGSEPNSRHTSGASFVSSPETSQSPQSLQYHRQLFETEDRRHSAGSNTSRNQVRRSSEGPILLSSKPSNQHLAPKSTLGANLARPSSGYSSSSDFPGRRSVSPGQFARTPSPSRLSPDSRPMSYIDLLNVPYPQPPPAPSNLDNSHLRSAVGQNASLLSTKKTLDMYRANVKKTNDPTIQYEFAVFMINTAQEMAASGQGDVIERQPSPRSNRDGDGPDGSTSTGSPAELLREARHILQKLSDRSYPFAQYYLADGYASGLFNKGVEDNDRAFPFFVAASKHGHAEAGYRAALCYEFGWGSRKDFNKAVQFYRQAASKNHPGAMSRLGRACLTGDMGLGNRYREGLKWLKRAAESADFQYNAAPYELGLLHETGFGDDIFEDEVYAAQLFTQSADLGHVEANYRLGDAYEHGKLSCPKDPALSVHFYTRAAEREHPLAMMALCAWYMVGAEPVLEKDENEAYEWARKAAETGLPKAEYAVGYFTEMGIGCRRDALESNRWYVKAAESGDERAKLRLAAITAAASGGSSASSASQNASKASSGKTGESGKSKKWGLF
ncbi:hypothetical protein OEA41_008547 [Lepraria neglecta]|uniref:HCP-like protein n=1 Tax=Lepraria neglecta TaxID=209136 RepID=A0AAD9ZG03_9LECA|nr:hypothetical protein OEA41_008547 [Lepraria neglecta]